MEVYVQFIMKIFFWLKKSFVQLIFVNTRLFNNMSPIFKCLICRKDIERSTKTFWKKKGHLLCSTCLDGIDKNQPNTTG